MVSTIVYIRHNFSANIALIFIEIFLVLKKTYIDYKFIIGYKIKSVLLFTQSFSQYKMLLDQC